MDAFEGSQGDDLPGWPSRNKLTQGNTINHVTSLEPYQDKQRIWVLKPIAESLENQITDAAVADLVRFPNHPDPGGESSFTSSTPRPYWPPNSKTASQMSVIHRNSEDRLWAHTSKPSTWPSNAATVPS